MPKVTVLFCQKDSIYKKMGCNCYDQERDALTWMGSEPAIYHPPCRLWSRMRHFSTADDSERYLALWAVNNVRRYGGILEHPASSSLFPFMNLPVPGSSDEFGFTIEIDQFNFGHLARKRTWLYICGITPAEVIPFLRKKISAKCSYVVSSSKSGKVELTAKMRSETPRMMARQFVKIIQQFNT